MTNLGKILKRMRQKAGLRQEDLAKMLNVERVIVANWERGAKYPSLNTMVRLCEIFGVTLDQLVGRKESIEPKFDFNPSLLAVDPLVKLLAKRTGVPAKNIAAFIVAFQNMPNGN